jgi:hypothetical protein
MSMQKLPISQDDVTDVREMSKKIAQRINRVLNGHNTNIAMSALINATIHSMLTQCEEIEDFVKYGTIFMHVVDEAIWQIQIKNKH